jgi:hypothetical protein
VTGFIFKVQANMDPMHRDRIAFMRLVSGTFKRGMKLTPSALGKPIAIHSPILFFAQDREIADRPSPAISSAFPTMAPCGWAILCPKRTRCASPACPISRRKSCAAWR